MSTDIPHNSANNSTLRFIERFSALQAQLKETEEETAKRLNYSRSWIQKVKKGIVEPKGKAWAKLEAVERGHPELVKKLHIMADAPGEEEPTDNEELTAFELAVLEKLNTLTEEIRKLRNDLKK